MTQVVVPPPIIDGIVGYLRDELEELDVDAADGAEVHGAVPNPRPAKFVTVVRIGGFIRDRVLFTATVTFEACGPTDEEASDLADVAYALMHALKGRQQDVTFYGVDDIAGPANLPDPVSEQPRFVFTLGVRGRAVAI